MKFDLLYPYQSTKTNQIAIKFEGSELVKLGDPKPCWHCETPTSWIDVMFEAHICSEECERAKWAEYVTALRFGISEG